MTKAKDEDQLAAATMLNPVRRVSLVSDLVPPDDHTKIDL